MHNPGIGESPKPSSSAGLPTVVQPPPNGVRNAPSVTDFTFSTRLIVAMAALATPNTVALGSRAVSGRRVAARKATVASCPARAGVVVRASATERKYNFSAGPACLPLDVLEECKEDLINYKGTGMSVMEMSHRGKDFMKIAEEAEADLRELVGIPDNYKVRARGADSPSPVAHVCEKPAARRPEGVIFILTILPPHPAPRAVPDTIDPPLLAPRRCCSFRAAPPLSSRRFR